MSVWTHVAGVIRIDAVLPFKRGDFEKKLGKVLSSDMSKKTWDDAAEHPSKYTPYGSEGGIQYSIWENPDEDSRVKYTVSIFGDLKDYTDVKKIKDWFNTVLYDKDLMIRDAILHINCDDGQESVVKYDWNTLVKVLLKRDKKYHD